MKFKNRVIAAITVSSVLFIFIFGFFAIRKEMNTEKERLKSKIIHYNSLVEKINTESLWDFDIPKIKANLNLIFSDPEVFEVHVSDVTGTIDVLMSKKEGSGYYPDLKYELNIEREGIVLGKARIVYSDELYTQKLYSLITEKLLLTLGIILINILAVYFISGYLLRPIDSIVEALKEIDSGNRGVRLSFLSGDEFGEIEEYFNRMACTIQSEIETRIERESQLNDMHQYLSSIFDSIPSMLISVDSKGAIRSVNAAAEKYSGMKSSEILGRDVKNIFTLLQGFSEDIQKVIESEQNLSIKNHYKSANEDLQIDISISSLHHGGITGAVIRLDDVTVLKKKDEKLNQAQMMDSIGNLAGGIAHDFNNVLSGITGTVSLLKHRLGRNELRQEDLHRFLNVIDDSGKRAVDLTRQILTLSRKSDMSIEYADLNTLLRHVYDFCSHSFEKSIELNVRYYPGPAMAAVDATRIEQVLLNLCINAGDAMTVMKPADHKRGGVLNMVLGRLNHDAVHHLNAVEAEAGKDYWTISVEDNGVGMDKKIAERIFEPFFTTKDKGKGTGLGLAMAYNIIRVHKGFIDVTSEPGKGTVFNVYIPVSDEGAPVKEEYNSSPASGKGRIFVIDDEESICETSKELLEYCGYEVVTECVPDSAVDRFMKEGGYFDCVILDLNMPGRSGYELLQILKEGFPDVKILISSGSITDEKMNQLTSAGADGFISKPYTLASISEAVSRLIR